MRLLAPVRLSRLTDETTSPDTQNISIEDYAKLHKHTIVAATSDLDVSGGKPIRERPGVGPYLTEEKLAEWDGIIGYKIDRLFRNHYDFVTFVHEICEPHGKVIISVGEGIDSSTPMGKFIMGILVQFAEWELMRMGDRRRDSKVRIQQQGRWGGGIPPYGYKPKQVSGGFVLIPDEKAAPVVGEMIELLLAGNSMNEIARQFTARKVPTPKGGPAWHADVISRILRSPALCGYVTQANTGEDAQIVRDKDGLPVRFTDTPLTDQKTYARVQDVIAVLTTNRGKGVRRDAAPLLNIAFCGECGRKLYSHMNKPRFYYKCSGVKDKLCKAPTVRKELLESLTHEILLDSAGDVPMKIKVVTPAEDHEQELATIASQLDDLAEQASQGKLSAEAYARVATRLETRQAALEALPSRPEQTAWEPTGQTFAAYWGSLTEKQKRTFMLSAGIQVSAEASPDDQSFPWPDPSGRVVAVAGQGWRITIHLGDLAELRELASQAD